MPRFVSVPAVLWPGRVDLAGCAPACKAPPFPREINDLPEIPYRDIRRTQGEPDTGRSPPPEKRNPAALAGATGFKATDEAAKLRTTGYRKGSPGAILSRHIKDPHRRASRILGYALTADAPDIWATAGMLWTLHLEREERVALAFTALRALSAEDRVAVAEAAGRAG